MYNYLKYFSITYTTAAIVNDINWQDSDVFLRIKKVVMSKFKVFLKYPYMADFTAIAFEGQSSEEILDIVPNFPFTLTEDIYSKNIDYTLFKEDIDIERSINILKWTLEGYTDQLIELIKLSNSKFNLAKIEEEILIYIEILKKAFYKWKVLKKRSLYMISVKNLSHSYNKDGKQQLKDVSFEVAKGEVFGFLGPSGAGKSTTQNILTGLLQPQVGEVTVAGHRLDSISNDLFNKIGMSFEQSNVYSKLTAKENLDFYAKLFDVETIDSLELLKMVGLDGKEDTRAGEFSKGMKHRLTFARSMINKPELWFLDEPTTGLDPSIAADIKDIIKAKNKEGVTIFLTTHNMFIADELCDRVAFIVDGEIKLIDSPENLKLQYGNKLVEVEYIDNKKVVKKTLSTVLLEDKTELQNIIEHHDIQTMHTKEATLEEIFIKVTGRELV